MTRWNDEKHLAVTVFMMPRMMTNPNTYLNDGKNSGL